MASASAHRAASADAPLSQGSQETTYRDTTPSEPPHFSTRAIFSNLRQTGGAVRQAVMVKWRLRNTLQSSFHIGAGSGGRALEKDDPDEINRFGAEECIDGGDDRRSAIGRLVRFGGAGGRRGFRAAVPRSRRPRAAG